MGARGRRVRRLAGQVAEIARRVTAVSRELDELRAQLRERVTTRALVVEASDTGPAVLAGAAHDRAFVQVVARRGAELIAVELFATVIDRDRRVGADVTVGGDVAAVVEAGAHSRPTFWTAAEGGADPLGDR